LDSRPADYKSAALARLSYIGMSLYKSGDFKMFLKRIIIIPL